MKNRLLTFWREHSQLVVTAGGFLVFGVIYWLVVKLTPIRLKCILHEITGLYCPGCGISRFFLELIGLHFQSAVRQNLAVAVLLPVWSIIAVVEFFFNPRIFEKNSKVIKIMNGGTLAVLIIFGILRNIPGFEWLQPTL